MHAAPVSQTDRLGVIDAIRGVALLGILLMNVPYMGNAYQAHFNINILPGDGSGANFWCWWTVNHFFEGTMRALFSMLFGAGSVLLLDRLERNPPPGITPADIFYRRLIWLLIFGLFNAYVLMWAGDILYAYAICGLFLYPFRHVKPKKLLVFSVVLMFFSTLQHSAKMWDAAGKREKGQAAQLLVRQEVALTEAQKESLDAWKEYQHEHSLTHQRAMVAKEIADMQEGTLTSIFGKMAEVNGYIETKDMYNELFFDVLAFFMLGMALFRSGYVTGSWPAGRYLAFAMAGYAVGILLSHYIIRSMVQVGFDQSLLPRYFSLSLYQVKRCALAIGHFSLLLLLFRLNWIPLFFRMLAPVGQMAFTNYLMQSIFAALFFHGYGFAMFGRLERYELYLYVACVWIFQIIFSAVWLKIFRFGPFEWLWRSLTYWKMPPMLRSNQE